MQHALPRDDAGTLRTLSLPERTFLRSAARGASSSRGSLLRLDGRSPSEARSVSASFARSHNRAECTARLGGAGGSTRCAASVRAELVPPPNPDRPNDGQVRFGVEMSPAACAGYEAAAPASNHNVAPGDAADGAGGGGGGGAQLEGSQKLRSNGILRLLERIILTGGSIDAEALCVQSGRWVWRLNVDVSLIDDGGNAVDACVFAALAALRHFRLPEVDAGGGDDDGARGDGGDDDPRSEGPIVVHSDDREPAPLPLHHTPLTATFALFSDESGTSTSVSVLLDPTDREELARNGTLTWSYNRHGEMCCLDFPGGCELRPRQLVKCAGLGKRRCVELCELLEVALTEANAKADKERMERLRKVREERMKRHRRRSKGDNGDHVMTDAVPEPAPALPENVPYAESQPSTDVPHDGIFDAASASAAAALEEEEKYRLRALDYASGHIAASVKDDRAGGRPKIAGKRDALGGGRESSSLFRAILRSARSSSTGATAGEVKPQVTSDRSNTGKEKVSPVEIVAHRKKTGSGGGRPDEQSKQTPSGAERQAEKEATSAAAGSDEEEEVVTLRDEFAAVPDSKIGGGGGKTSNGIEKNGPNTIPPPPSETTAPKKGATAMTVVPDDGDDVDDLTMAVKKKKSKKGKKKK